MKNYIYLLATIITVACQSNAQTDVDISASDNQEFKDYWYAGQAELTSFDLEQSRYGELHKGSAVLIFVTEDFSKNKQVKLDDPGDQVAGQVKVMKLNFTKKFNTGIYPYSMMSSCFTPVDIQSNPHSIKITTSSQEWCGHTYLQLNLQDDHYKMAGFSYFETEGDYEKELSKSTLEDEIWNIIRLDPSKLPIGKINIIPGTFASRLLHFPLKKVKATATLTNEPQDQGGVELVSYTINYQNPERTLKIVYSKIFPYQIVRWEESSRRRDGKIITTKAERKKTIKLDYWNKNKPQDLIYREKLGLK